MKARAMSFAELRAMPLDRIAKILPTLDRRITHAPMKELAELLAEPPPTPFSIDGAARAFVAERARTPAHKRINGLREFEEAIIVAALAHTNANMSAAARLLRVERKAFERRARKYGAR